MHNYYCLRISQKHYKLTLSAFLHHFYFTSVENIVLKYFVYLSQDLQNSTIMKIVKNSTAENKFSYTQISLRLHM